MILLLIILFLHTILSFQKNKIGGLIIPFFTLIVLVTITLDFNSSLENYVIMSSEGQEHYHNLQQYEERLKELIDSSVRFEATVPENTDFFALIGKGIVTFVLLMECVIYGIGLIYKNRRFKYEK